MLLKIVGVGYLSEFAAGVLMDFGCVSIADKVTLAGKITIVLLSFPVLESLLQLIGGFLQLVWYEKKKGVFNFYKFIHFFVFVF